MFYLSDPAWSRNVLNFLSIYNGKINNQPQVGEKDGSVHDLIEVQNKPVDVPVLRPVDQPMNELINLVFIKSPTHLSIRLGCSVSDSVSVYLNISAFVCLSIHRVSMYLSTVCLCVFLYTVSMYYHVSMCLSTYRVCMCMSIYRVCMCMSIYHVSVYLSIYRVFIRLPIYRVSICLPFYRLSTCLSTYRVSMCLSKSVKSRLISG